MSSFIIKGDCDDALAKLKSTLKAQDAKFDANLQSQFKLPAAPPRKPVAAAQPAPPQKPVAAVPPMLARKPVAAAPMGKPASATGSLTGSMLSSRNTDDSVRGRLRTSLRSTPSR